MMSPALRTSLAIATLAGFIALCGAIAATGFLLADREQRLTEAQLSRLAALRQTLAAEASRAERKEKPTPVAAGLFLSKAAVGLAGARLQKDIISDITRRDGIVSSASIASSIAESRTRLATPITVDVTFRITTAGLKDLLFDIENRTPLTFIDSIDVRREDQGRGVAVNRKSQTEPVLRVSLRVTGYLAPTVTAQAKPAAG